jgi:hypothetical protein
MHRQTYDLEEDEEQVKEEGNEAPEYETDLLPPITQLGDRSRRDPLVGPRCPRADCVGTSYTSLHHEPISFSFIFNICSQSLRCIY